MSDFSENIHTIYNNPFILTPILLSFYKNYLGSDKDILLAYLIFPIVLEPDHVDKIKVITSKTSLTRFTNNKDFMSGFYTRLKLYKKVTNHCLQYAIDCQYIKIDESMRVEVINEDTLYYEPSLEKALKLSGSLHKVFKRINVTNIYQAFGIKAL